MEIGGFNLEEKCMLVAELSANHGGSKETALKTIEAAARAGADAIKLQTFTPDTITIDCDNEYFRIDHGTLWDGETLYSLYQKAFTPWEWHRELFDKARELGLICFSSPFDPTAVDFLEELEVPAYKIASFEIHDIPLIEYAASKGKPMIISTGIATEADISEALEACWRVGNHNIILLKCTSAYPASIDSLNLSTIPSMREKFGVEVGLSDHSLGNYAPIIARSLGARFIEKHFTIDKNNQSPDSAFSLDESEFQSMRDAVRNTELALGSISYGLPPDKSYNLKFGRSLFVVKDIKKGERLSLDNIRSIRPNAGLEPKMLSSMLGRKVGQDLEKGTPLKLDYLLHD